MSSAMTAPNATNAITHESTDSQRESGPAAEGPEMVWPPRGLPQRWQKRAFDQTGASQWLHGAGARENPM
jgi:hypothetical protein